MEADESFIGGKARNMHVSERKRRITGTGTKDKTAVMGILERGGKVRATVVTNRRKGTLQAEVRKHVEAGAALYTDALLSYEGLAGDYAHQVSWAVNVREQYEPAKRAIRFFRWHHRLRFENAAARLFYREASKWKGDTMHWSSVTKMIAHPSYLRIVGLGRKFRQGEIERLILEELQNEPDYWFDALAAITGEDPVGPNDDFDAAVNAWLQWGRENGIISSMENDKSRRIEA